MFNEHLIRGEQAVERWWLVINYKDYPILFLEIMFCVVHHLQTETDYLKMAIIKLYNVSMDQLGTKASQDERWKYGTILLTKWEPNILNVGQLL